MSQDASGLYKGIASLGNAIALGAALLGTPLAFNLTKAALFQYFSGAWGREAAGILIWVMAALEAYVIYATVSFVFTAGMVWIMTTIATRKFGGSS